MKALLFFITLLSIIDIKSQTPWAPSAAQRVPEIADCTIGDIASARVQPSPHIRYCPQAVAQLNSTFPGAGHFYYVHEYGHILLASANEAEADKFAATQLSSLPGGYYYINAVIAQLHYRASMGEGSYPGYGTPMQRANRLLSFSINSNSNLATNSNGFLYLK